MLFCYLIADFFISTICSRLSVISLLSSRFSSIRFDSFCRLGNLNGFSNFSFTLRFRLLSSFSDLGLLSCLSGLGLICRFRFLGSLDDLDRLNSVNWFSHFSYISRLSHFISFGKLDNISHLCTCRSGCCLTNEVDHNSNHQRKQCDANNPLVPSSNIDQWHPRRCDGSVETDPAGNQS